MSEHLERSENVASEAVDLSIVSSLYLSSGHVEEFVRRAIRAAEGLGVSFEVVLVNDGSPDDSLDKALALARRDSRILVVDLSRNFGHHMAFMAGVDHAKGRRLFLIDSDLEEEPEWLDRFWDQMESSGGDVVYGVQRQRSGGLWKRWTGQAFYRVFNAISEQTIPANPCTVRLMTGRYAEALRRLRDRNLFLAGNYAWAGFHQVPLPVQRERPHSLTTYTPLRLFRLFVDAVVSFSATPLRWIFFLGLSISSLSGLVGLAILVRKIVDPSRVLVGWASVMVSVWFLGGTIILISGVLGLYVGAVFVETKHRPPYLVRAVHRPGGTDGGRP